MSASVLFFQDLVSKVTTAQILRVILDHNIDKDLLSGPKSIEELAAGKKVNLDNLHRLLSQLEANGLFSYDSETQKWSHNELSASLVNPFINSLCQCHFSPLYFEKFLALEKVLEFNQSAFALSGEGNVFDVLKKNAAILNKFQNLMAESTKISQPAILNSLDLAGVNRVLDVGGGDGSLCIALSQQHPDKEYGVFELGESAEIAEKNISELNLNEKIKVISGSFLESVPGGFDAIILKYIIHDWPDDTALTILRNCRNALESGKKLFIIGAIIERSDKSFQYFSTIDVRMMVMGAGKERTKDQIEELMRLSGFSFEKFVNLGTSCIIEGIAI